MNKINKLLILFFSLALIAQPVHAIKGHSPTYKVQNCTMDEIEILGQGRICGGFFKDGINPTNTNPDMITILYKYRCSGGVIIWDGYDHVITPEEKKTGIITILPEMHLQTS